VKPDRRSARKERRDRDPVRVGEVLDAFLDRAGMRVQLERTGVLEEWPARVGEAIARVTHARSVSEGTLIVEVRSSAWLMELNIMKGEILRRLNDGRQEAGIERIVFVLGEQPVARGNVEGAPGAAR
jgi:predicted nucleic acid-binding Zn ribbon protein